MNVGRVCVVAAALVVIALVVVHLRAEQTRSAARLLTLESRWVQLRREAWTLQTRAARLQTPQRLHERMALLRSDLIAPAIRAQPHVPVRLASDPWRE